MFAADKWDAEQNKPRDWTRAERASSSSSHSVRTPSSREPSVAGAAPTVVASVVAAKRAAKPQPPVMLGDGWQSNPYVKPPAAPKRPRIETESFHCRNWSPAETALLFSLVEQHGEGGWDAKAARLGTQRSTKAVKEKYYTTRKSQQAAAEQSPSASKLMAIPQVVRPTATTTRPAGAAVAAARSHTPPPVRSDFGGIEWVASTAAWRLKGPFAEEVMVLRFKDERAAARGYDVAVGQWVNFTLGYEEATVTYEMIGQGAQARWNAEEAYCGEVAAVDLRTNKAMIRYDDGQEGWEKVVASEDGVEQGDDTILLRMLAPNSAADVTLRQENLEEVKAALVEVDKPLIVQYLAFWAQEGQRSATRDQPEAPPHQVVCT